MLLNKLSFLITGGAGFIGSHIAHYLIKNNAKYVRVIDNLSNGNINNIKDLLNHSNFEFVWGDINDIETCRKCMENTNIICHQAAIGSVPRSLEDPLNTHRSNVNGFLNILIAAKEKNIKRIVYASSSSVYGDNEKLPKIENEIGHQLSPYAVSKYVDELYANVFYKCYGIETIGLRYFNVFGPKQNPNGCYAAVIPKFILQIVKNIRPVINGDGNYSRDFTYIDNVVNANVLAMLTERSECFGEVFNIGNGGRITILEMFDIIKNCLGSDIQPIFSNIRKGDIPHSNANIDKATSLLNYTPVKSFSDGILETIEYYKNNTDVC